MAMPIEMLNRDIRFDKINSLDHRLRLLEKKRLNLNRITDIISISVLSISIITTILLSTLISWDFMWSINILLVSIIIITILQLNVKSYFRYKYLSEEKGLKESYKEMAEYKTMSRKFRNRPKLVDSSHPFYYLDSKIVSKLFPKIISREKVRYIDELEKRVLKTDIHGNLLIVEGGFGKARVSETKSRKELVDSPLIQYEKIESYLYRRNLLNFNLEKFETDETKVNELEEIFNTISNKFRINIPEKENYLTQVTNAYAEDKLKKFPEVSGYIYLTAEFTVSKKDDVNVVLEYRHPITNFLETQNPPVKLQIKGVSENIEEFGISTFELNKSNKITCLGQIIRWTEETRVFEIYPIAIY